MRHLIVNADDFGYSEGVNRGIVESHDDGIVTSTSFMVTGHAVEEALELARDRPALGLGLHFDVWGEDEREFDIENVPAVRDELRRQVEEFVALVGRPPTHLDSHRHVHHRSDALFQVFREQATELGVPLRFDETVEYVGHFYAQWEWQVTELERISPETLCGLLRDLVGEGWTELACHPGYMPADSPIVYSREREVEVRSLCDDRVRATVEAEGILLRNFDDLKAPAA